MPAPDALSLNPFDALVHIGIPPDILSAFTMFLLLLLAGGRVISTILSHTAKDFDSLSEETKAGWVALFHIPSLFFVPVLTWLNTGLGIASALVFVVGLPAVTGQYIHVKEGKREEKESRPAEVVEKVVSKKRDVSVAKQLFGKVKKTVKEEGEEEKKGEEKKAEEKKEKEKKEEKEKPRFTHRVLNILRTLRKRVHKARKAHHRAKIRVEEVLPTRQAERRERARQPKETIPGKKRETESQTREREIKTMREVLDRIEKKYIKQGSRPAQAGTQVDKQKAVQEVIRKVERKVDLAVRRHRFVTWREAREAKKRASAALHAMVPEIERRIGEVDRPTREDIRTIADQIFEQIKPEEIIEEVRGEEPKHRRRRAERTEEKKETEAKEEGEDILSLLEESGEGQTEETGEEMDELKELEKLLKEG